MLAKISRAEYSVRPIFGRLLPTPFCISGNHLVPIGCYFYLFVPFWASVIMELLTWSLRRTHADRIKCKQNLHLRVAGRPPESRLGVRGDGVNFGTPSLRRLSTPKRNPIALTITLSTMIQESIININNYQFCAFLGGG